MRRIFLPTLAALVASALLAVPASAVYIETPLLLHGPDEADAGETIDLRIEPTDGNATRFANATVKIVYAFDTAEGEDQGPDAPMSNQTMQQRVLLEALVLDADGRATFQWTVPAETDGYNVDLYVELDDERVAFAYVAVGDAPPVMRIMAGSGPAQGAPEPDLETGPDSTTPAPADEDADDVGNDAPGAGVLAAGLAIGLAGLAIGRRK